MKQHDKNKRKLYSSKEWRRLSNRFRKNNPLCVRCLARGVHRVSEVADHNDPLWQGREILTTRLNALCKQCHLDKTTLEDYPKMKIAKKTAFNFFKV